MTNSAAGSIYDELLCRIDNSTESRLFRKIVILVSLGMLEASIDVYMGSAVAGSLTASKWSTSQETSMFLSANFLGLLIGSLIAGLIGDCKGRKVAYQINLLLFGGFTVLGAFSPNMDMLIVCRFLAGIGLGSEIVTGFAFINEFAPVARRGRWCGLVSLVANCGLPTSILLSALIIPNTSWRVVFFAVGILAIVLWFFRKDIPESPRWLISKGRYREAALIVEQLSSASTATNYGNNDKLKRTALQNPDQQDNLFVMLTVGVVAAVAANVCSYTFTTWVPTILVSKGISLSSSLLTSSLMMFGAPFGCLMALLLLDKIGRKKDDCIGFSDDSDSRNSLCKASNNNFSDNTGVLFGIVFVYTHCCCYGCLCSRIISNTNPFPLRRHSKRCGKIRKCFYATVYSFSPSKETRRADICKH